MAKPPPSRKSKGECMQFSKGGCSLTVKYKPHVVSQHSLEALAAGSQDLTHPCAVCPYIPSYPPHLVFGNDHSPRVVSKPLQSLLLQLRFYQYESL